MGKDDNKISNNEKIDRRRLNVEDKKNMQNDENIKKQIEQKRF